ncbi:hypothetical protein Nwi_1558 [Nitrobacter winogradskyi Nb-255]|uniref:Uncharacterized protein n=1 Tax=Nitrobacter winogradskyi (strain ATCC 25391 / DSM 10237 / CIP 104748 / NCIMB 11846 / Nb-255) TaxID=323098 RepID=Q3SSC2_NITWN|nr:hypothetical protein [Nitrobacter winogradskyi]ABA04819.1 hypothetical protein Nwi_1558 [Nitrobacter winogradskyi Nb-255]
MSDDERKWPYGLATDHIDRLHDLDLHPPEVFSDAAQIFESGGILRFVFRASRPELGDPYSDPTVPVARVAISRRYFTAALQDALAKLPPG